MAAATSVEHSQIMAPLKPIGDSIPNHLTETRIFSHVKDHHLVKARPKSIHFEGYRVGRLHQKTLSLANGSPDALDFHIIPPSTQFFKVSYHKTRSKLMPGLSLSINIQFKPDQWKYYYDCIRVHCKGNENILIPIHAYPAMDVSHVPRSITFQPTPIGQSRTHLLSLQSDIPVDFEYELEYEDSHPAFTITPMKGIVAGNSRTSIRVAFAPTEFATAVMKVKLEVSQFNSKPVYCTFTGTSAPGLGIEQYKEKQKSSSKANIPKRSTPTTKLTKKQKLKQTTSTKKPTESAHVYEGVEFPPNLYNPSAVAHVLNQEAGKMKASQLRKAQSKQEGNQSRENSKQLKESIFMKKVKEKADQEAKNKIKWITQIGCDPVSDEMTKEILQDREQAQKVYKIVSHIFDTEVNCKRMNTVCSKRKTRRIVTKKEDDEEKKEELIASVLFDAQSNNLWDIKHRSLQRFAHAARTIIIRNRCQRKLGKLRELMRAVKGGETTVLTQTDKEERRIGSALNISPLDLLPSVFPSYEVITKDSQESSISAVPTTPAHIKLDTPLSLMDLMVPEQYKLLGYTKLLVPITDSFTIPDIKERPLLTGAEDEYQDLTPVPGLDTHYQSVQQLNSDNEGAGKGSGDIVVEDAEGSSDITPLIPPPSMFISPVTTREIHNPCPSVIDGLRPMIPNSEVTHEHALLPLPSPTLAPRPHPYLDPEDGISGIMKWKQFNSSFLSSLDEQRDLVSSWQPIQSDTLSHDLLPAMPHPHQLTGPQDDDFVDNSNDNIPMLTNEGLHKEFCVPSPQISSNPIGLCQRHDHEVLLIQHQKELLNEVGKQHENKYNDIIQLINPQQSK